jgi:hypothetical protein
VGIDLVTAMADVVTVAADVATVRVDVVIEGVGAVPVGRPPAPRSAFDPRVERLPEVGRWD